MTTRWTDPEFDDRCKKDEPAARAHAFLGMRPGVACGATTVLVAMLAAYTTLEGPSAATTRPRARRVSIAWPAQVRTAPPRIAPRVPGPPLRRGRFTPAPPMAFDPPMVVPARPGIDEAMIHEARTDLDPGMIVPAHPSFGPIDAVPIAPGPPAVRAPARTTPGR
ncbi:hypothetical protein [Paludisphaera mucosa]|uniref:Uncharacterized protein n=1 Tax=Paludisphaera mucosa TaxID=3030827 RepID=A0ABT6FKB1_9BACT|nr:hypothetical protein [Paludisphaera mucosa]MDG3008018.1 hypothetical protein [Paludisphaera mucosa]